MVSPPRLLPMAFGWLIRRAGIPFRGTCAVLMHLGETAVHLNGPQVQVSAGGLEHTVEHAGLGPSGESLVDGAPLAKLLPEITPTGAEAQQNARELEITASVIVVCCTIRESSCTKIFPETCPGFSTALQMVANLVTMPYCGLDHEHTKGQGLHLRKRPLAQTRRLYAEPLCQSHHRDRDPNRPSIRRGGAEPSSRSQGVTPQGPAGSAYRPFTSKTRTYDTPAILPLPSAVSPSCGQGGAGEWGELMPYPRSKRHPQEH